MNVVNGHAHGNYGYGPVGLINYWQLLVNAVETKIKGYLSLNLHLPFEVQHPKVYPNLSAGLRLIHFGETVRRLFRIKIVWENAPAQKEISGQWSLKYSQTDWSQVPDKIDLTLDTGHLMLGAENIAGARIRIETILKNRGKQIKHLHLHENDLLHDTHEPVGKLIDKKLLAKLIKNRTYIFEKGVAQDKW